MDTNDKRAEASFALALDQQRQELLNTAMGTRWKDSGGTWDIFVFLFACVLFALAFTSEERLSGLSAVASVAAFGILSVYMAINIQMQRRIRAILRLLEHLERR